jgi:hypothetical protein
LPDGSAEWRVQVLMRQRYVRWTAAKQPPSNIIGYW